MIKTLLSILFLLSVYFNSGAQSYVPMLDLINRWTFIFDFIPVSPDLTNCSYQNFDANFMTADTDTVISGLKYKKIYAYTTCLFGYVREDTTTRKIYFIDNQLNPELLTYDFSMQINDSLHIQFYNQSAWQYWSDGYYVLDSITSKWTVAGMRKQLNLNCHSCVNSNTLIWIEGVGNSSNPIYNFSSNRWDYGMLSNFGCPGYPYEKGGAILSCFEHAQKVYYDSFALGIATSVPGYVFNNTCDYFWCCGSANDFDFSSTVKIKTNPFHDKTELLIENNETNIYQLEIFNQTGRRVRNEVVKKDRIIIERKNLSNGMYIYLLIDKKGHYAKGKLLIQ